MGTSKGHCIHFSCAKRGKGSWAMVCCVCIAAEWQRTLYTTPGKLTRSEFVGQFPQAHKGVDPCASTTAIPCDCSLVRLIKQQRPLAQTAVSSHAHDFGAIAAASAGWGAEPHDTTHCKWPTPFLPIPALPVSHNQHTTGVFHHFPSIDKDLLERHAVVLAPCHVSPAPHESLALSTGRQATIPSREHNDCHYHNTEPPISAHKMAKFNPHHTHRYVCQR